LKKLREIQEKYNIKLKTKVNENGEEVVCLDIPYSQKIRNECTDYEYFYTYKKERTKELQDQSELKKDSW